MAIAKPKAPRMPGKPQRSGRAMILFACKRQRVMFELPLAGAAER
jgi:hypothetical protein